MDSPFAVLCRPGCHFANCVMVRDVLELDYRGLDLLGQDRQMLLQVHSCCHLETSSSVVMAEELCSCEAHPCGVTFRSAHVMLSVVVSCVMDDLHCDNFLMMIEGHRGLHHLLHPPFLRLILRILRSRK